MMTEFIAGVATGAVLSLSSMVAYMIGKRNATIHAKVPVKPMKPTRPGKSTDRIVKPVGKGRTEVRFNGNERYDK